MSIESNNLVNNRGRGWVLFCDNRNPSFLMLRNLEKRKNKLRISVIGCWQGYGNTLFFKGGNQKFFGESSDNNPFSAKRKL